MMTCVAASKQETKEFLEILDTGEYEKRVRGQKGRSPLLGVGKTALIHLYLMAFPLLRMRDEMGKKQTELLEDAFLECFIGIQMEGCDPFSAESIRLLESERAVQRCMECASVLSGPKQEKFLEYFKGQTPEKIIFCYGYIKHQELQKQMLGLLLHKAEEDLSRNIYFFPTWTALIDKIFHICLDNGDISKWDSYGEGNLIVMLRESLRKQFEAFKKAVRKRGFVVERDQGEWIQDMELRLNLLYNREEDLLAEKPGDAKVCFYQGLIYLNREDLESLKKAADSFDSLKSAGDITCAAYINDYVSSVRICTHETISEEDREKFLEKAEQTREEIQRRFPLTMREQKILWSNELYLYRTLRDQKKFWQASARMPQELDQELDCVRYQIEMLIGLKEYQQAEQKLDMLQRSYGTTEEILGMRKSIQSGVWQQSKRPAGKAVSFDEIEYLRNAYNRIHTLTERELALVRLQRDGREDPKEKNLLSMVLHAAGVLNQYSHYLVFSERAAEENSYNKQIQILLEQRNTEVWAFSVKDQSQEGGTPAIQKKNGQSGIGNADLTVWHREEMCSIIEGMRLDSVRKAYIENHIRRLALYNYANISTAFILVYANTARLKAFWERYERYLGVLQKETEANDWRIRKIYEKEEIPCLKELNQDDNGLMMCMTEHVCGSAGSRLHVYHILIDIKKDAAKREAEALK